METTYSTWEGSLSAEHVADELKKSLFGSLDEQVTPEALRAEILRVALWELSVLRRPGSIEEAAVSTRKILHRARILLEPFKTYTPSSSVLSSSDPPDRDVAEDNLNRESLDALAAQGDIQLYAGGRWVPAPLRFVSLMHDQTLVVGGMPTALLPARLRHHLQFHSSFRRSHGDPSVAVMGEKGVRQFQSVESWLGSPAVSLPELLQRFQTMMLLPVEMSSSFSDFDVYLPASSFSGQFQLGRWKLTEHVAADGRYLLRRRNSWGLDEYTIGLFEQQKLKAQGIINADLEIRRLLYALDAQANNPTIAKWDKEQGILTLHSELPMYERKYLATLGTLKKNSDRNYYPRVWQVPLSSAAKIRELLTHLKIDIQ